MQIDWKLLIERTSVMMSLFDERNVKQIDSFTHRQVRNELVHREFLQHIQLLRSLQVGL